MFQEKEKEEYKKITAPPELKDKIISSFQENNDMETAGNAVSNPVTERMRGKFPFGRWEQYRKVAVVCASCMILLIGVFCIQRANHQTSSQPNAVLYLYGTQVTKEPIEISTPTVAVAALYERSSPDMKIPLDIEVVENTRITVTYGTIEVIDKETEQVIESGNPLEIKENQSICWCMIPNEEDSPEMTLEQNGNQQVYGLSFDEEKQSYTLYKK
ncbi:MAG: hypothetical protein IJA10_13695 [Lachnospiraceae bacterium]|nr:hypothetical protein [Lachnospiraceae bacterium]